MAKSETEGKSGERESKGWLVTYDRFEYARSREAAWEQARRFAAKLDLSVNAVAKAEGFVMGDDAAYCESHGWHIAGEVDPNVCVLLTVRSPAEREAFLRNTAAEGETPSPPKPGCSDYTQGYGDGKCTCGAPYEAHTFTAGGPSRDESDDPEGYVRDARAEEAPLLAYNRPRCPHCHGELSRNSDGALVPHDHTDDTPGALEDRPRGDM